MSTILVVLIIFPTLWAGKPTYLTVLEDGTKISGGIDVYKLDGKTIIDEINNCKNLSGRKIYSMKVKTKPGGSSKEIDYDTKIKVPLLAEIHLYTEFPAKVWLNNQQSNYYVWIKSKKTTGTDIWDAVWAALYYHGVTKIRMPDGKEVKDYPEVLSTEGVQDIYVDVDAKAETTISCFIQQNDGKYMKTKDFTFVMSKRKYGSYIWDLIKTNILPKDQIIAYVRENNKDSDGYNDLSPVGETIRPAGVRSIYIQTKGDRKIEVKNGFYTLGNIYLGFYAFGEHIKLKVLQNWPKVDKVYWHGREVMDGSLQSTNVESIKVTLK